MGWSWSCLRNDFFHLRNLGERFRWETSNSQAQWGWLRLWYWVVWLICRHCIDSWCIVSALVGICLVSCSSSHSATVGHAWRDLGKKKNSSSDLLILSTHCTTLWICLTFFHNSLRPAFLLDAVFLRICQSWRLNLNNHLISFCLFFFLGCGLSPGNQTNLCKLPPALYLMKGRNNV